MSIPETRIKELVAHRWDLASETFDTHASHGIQSERERDSWENTFKKVFPEDCLKILDVGCGTGELSILFAEMGHEVTGIDLSEKMLEKAKSKAHARRMDLVFEKGDAESPAYGPASFDVVINRHLLWTLPNPQLAITNWKNVLREGGMAIIIDGIWDDGTLGTKLRRATSCLGTLIMERKNPRKGHCGYSEELKSMLPDVRGPPPEKVEGYLENAGFSSIENLPLTEILEIQKQHMPFRERISFNFQYYLVHGRK
ncbi:class I SAM-dependent methyltransferase [Methanosarcina sp. Mfa9]|uniref:class I SAM-dependent methyltransferase n=1 Tax=Methanosarcina sp. Mfa9 TaxID=3439063 RepID=UPI003F85721E